MNVLVKKLRLRNSWSQEQLSVFSGLNVKTIQRVEKGDKASLETLKSLAATFEIDIQLLTTPSKDSAEQSEDERIAEIEERKAFAHVKNVKDFLIHLMVFVCISIALAAMNFLISPHIIWFYWPILIWGSAVLVHALFAFEAFSLFSAEWELKQVEKKLGRKL